VTVTTDPNSDPADVQVSRCVGDLCELLGSGIVNAAGQVTVPLSTDLRCQDAVVAADLDQGTVGNLQFVECGAQAPVLSEKMLLVLAITLCLVGVRVLRRTHWSR
jgi:hypothetical protein